MNTQNYDPRTYGHSQLKTGHPVRSAIHKQLNGRLVLRWVTTWESLLLYVLLFVSLRYQHHATLDPKDNNFVPLLLNMSFGYSAWYIPFICTRR